MEFFGAVVLMYLRLDSVFHTFVLKLFFFLLGSHSRLLHLSKQLGIKVMSKRSTHPAMDF